MVVLVFFVVVILFSITLNIIDKVRAYRKPDHQVWEDGDTLIVTSEKDAKAPTGFSNKIS